MCYRVLCCFPHVFGCVPRLLTTGNSRRASSRHRRPTLPSRSPAASAVFTHILRIVSRSTVRTNVLRATGRSMYPPMIALILLMFAIPPILQFEIIVRRTARPLAVCCAAETVARHNSGSPADQPP